MLSPVCPQSGVREANRLSKTWLESLIFKVISTIPTYKNQRRGRDSNTSQNPLDIEFFGNGDAKCGAVATIEPDLALIVEAWATLPDALKAGIVAMVKAAGR